MGNWVRMSDMAADEMTEDANSDELAAFVASTLRAIASGIREAQSTKIASAHGTGTSGYAAPKEVEFDIAVSAKTTGSTGAGFKVAVFGIGANVGGDAGRENSNISRIKFSVPTNFKSSVSSPAIPTTTGWNRDK